MSASPSGPAVVFAYLRANRYGLHALAGALEAAGLFDPPRLFFPRGEEELVAGLGGIAARHAPLIVAISILSAQAGRVRRLAGRLREAAGGRAFLVAGGPHASGDPAGTLEMGFDAVAVGEGEETFCELVRTVVAGGSPETVRGLALRSPAGEVAFTGGRPPLDLDTVPSFAAAHHKLGPIEISRGCPFGCPFCQTSYLFGRRMRHRGLEAVSRHAQLLVRNGVRDVRFISPNAFGYGSADGLRPAPSRIEELLAAVRAILPPGGRIFFGTFPSEVRPDFVTPEIVGIARRFAGNRELVIGVQSGSPAMLAALGRGHTVEDAHAAVRAARAGGFTPIVDLIFGLPGETAQDEALTLEAMRELAGEGAVVHPHPFVPLPGTPWAGARSRPAGMRVRRAISALAARGAIHGDFRRKEAEAACV